MKKKVVYVIISLVLSLTAAGCGQEAKEQEAPETLAVEEILPEAQAEEEILPQDALIAEEVKRQETADSAPAEADSDQGEIDQSPAETEAGDGSQVDIDLSIMSSTMVYSEVYNMMVSPDNYKGKKIKMKGQYVPCYDETTGNYYFVCFISDAAACCSQGIEFILTQDYSFPEDYPTEGDTICVSGTFDTYLEGDAMYCTLRDATLK